MDTSISYSASVFISLNILTFPNQICTLMGRLLYLNLQVAFQSITVDYFNVIKSIGRYEHIKCLDSHIEAIKNFPKNQYYKWI